MAIGASGTHVPSTVPGHGPRPLAPELARHVTGSGPFPGDGAEAAEPSAQHDGNQPRTAGIK